MCLKHGLMVAAQSHEFTVCALGGTMFDNAQEFQQILANKQGRPQRRLGACSQSGGITAPQFGPISEPGFEQHGPIQKDCA